MKYLRNSNVDPVLQHEGTVKSYFMYGQQEIREATEGSFLEFVNEFTVEPGEYVHPHFHNSHEFYYVLSGRGIMRVGGEVFKVHPGDLIHTPPNVPPSLAAGTSGIRSLAFSCGFQKPGETHTDTEFDNWPLAIEES